MSIAAVALASVLAGPAAYSLDTASTPHTGSIPSAGPTVAGSFGPGGGGFPGGGGTPPTGGTFPGGGTAPGGGTSPVADVPGGGPPAVGPSPAVAPRRRHSSAAPAAGGGLLDSSTPSAALTKLLETDAGVYTWVAATIGSNNASGYQLATQLPVMPIGGFNGSDPSPTLAQFKAYVAAGRIHYFIAAGGGGWPPAATAARRSRSWVDEQLHRADRRWCHALRPVRRCPVTGDRSVTVDIVIPTYNEEHTLERCVWSLLDYLADVPFESRITIADNASTDRTPLIADRLARQFADVSVIHVPHKGRGLALKTAWSASRADVLVYMDVDLSTNLNALLPLVAPLLSGHSDLAIGTRLAPGARVLRGSKRELISRCYNLLLRGTLGAGFGDAQCGFKAIRADAARWLLPLVEDDSWFFDTELLVLAERAGLRIYQVPVDWVDDPDSRVDLWRTARDDLRGDRARRLEPRTRARSPCHQGSVAARWDDLSPHPGHAVRRHRGGVHDRATRWCSCCCAATWVRCRRTSLRCCRRPCSTRPRTGCGRSGARTGASGHPPGARVCSCWPSGLAVTTIALSLASDAGVSGTRPELVVLTAGEPARHGRAGSPPSGSGSSGHRGRNSAYDRQPARLLVPGQPCEGGSFAPATPLAQDQA